MAGRHRFELQLAVLETAMLPLHHQPVVISITQGGCKWATEIKKGHLQGVGEMGGDIFRG